MRKHFLPIAALGVFCSLAFAGCPWSSSPDVFEGAKGISMPNFGGGPPPQSEPPIFDEEATENTLKADRE